MSGVPGPVYLACDTPEQIKEAEGYAAELEALIREPLELEPMAVDDGALAAAGAEIAAARRVAIVVGPGVEHARAAEELVGALTALDAPACVTPEAVGLVPADHTLYAGMTGWHDAPIRALLPQADLVLTIGLDAADVMVPFRDLQRVIHLAPTPHDASSFQPVAHAVRGDLRVMLPRVAQLGRANREWGAAIARATRDAVDAGMAVSAAHRDADGIAPQDVFTSLRAILPPDTILTCDVGAHKIVAGTVWKSYRPQTFFMSNGFRSMGYGLATAMGVKLARPAAPVVSVIGDGGFLMYAGDVATWSRLGLPMVVIVMVDNDLTQIQRRQEREGYSTTSTTFQRVDYAAIARTLGIDAVTANDTATLIAAVTGAIAADRPMLVEAVLDSDEYRRTPGWK